ncbi:glycosyltransferase family 4 protein [Baekduia sp.]|uniref:glycosyltransferase family 4 protein n=1 Tax=Baekduia sp. TaxID=2600305 RepID=UPI002D1F9C5B|nr:glycosyltransferase family 4 protein [Baekduia sp.]
MNGAAGEPESAPQSVLVVGRTLHEPFNEGTRVIGRNLALSAARSGHHAQIISLSEPGYADAAEVGGVPLHHVVRRPTRSPLGDYRAVPALAAAVRSAAAAGPVNRIHLIGVPLMLAAGVRRQGRTIVNHVVLHAAETGLPATDRLREMLGWRVADRWIDGHAATSETVRAALENDGWNRAKLSVLEPAIDTDRFLRRTAEAHAPGTLRILYVGNIAPERFPAADVVLMLEGVAARSSLRLQLDVFAPITFRRDNAQWAARFPRSATVEVSVHLEDLTEQRKVEVYSGADVALYPFTRPVAVEPPLTILETMACETVPVVTAPANRSAIVEDGRTGLTCRDRAALGTALERFAGLSPAERAAMGHAAREAVVRRFGFGSIASDTELLWRRLDRAGGRMRGRR